MLGRLRRMLARMAEPALRRAVEREVTARTIERLLAKYKDEQQLAAFLNSQRLRLTVQPVVQDLPEGQRILVYAPHQDDETIGAGGLLIKAARAGKVIRTTYVTDGAADTKAGNARETLAPRRREEAGRVWHRIGGEIQFWDLPCRRIDVSEQNARTMRDQIEEFGPDTVLLPFFLDPPLDHRRTNELLRAAHQVRPLPSNLEVWAYQVSAIIAPNVAVDITDVIDEKEAVNELWESQNTSFNYAHYSRGMAAYNSVYLARRTTEEPRKLYAELFYVTDAPNYIRLLEHYEGTGHTDSQDEEGLT